MDPFEVRMQFLSLFRRMNATQQSIQKVVAFAVKYFSSCGEDIWDCIVGECQKGTLNTRINILYFLDSLCEKCLLVKSHSAAIGSKPSYGVSASNQYVDFVARDLKKIVDFVVPTGREGLPNLISTRQMLESWRSKRVVDPDVVNDAILLLQERSHTVPQDQLSDPSSSSSKTRKRSDDAFSRTAMFQRIEDDRERHKRLRERRWVQPVSFTSHMTPLASFYPLAHDGHRMHQEELPIDIEFENEWETTSDWNDDDNEAVTEEAALCFPNEGEGPMDLS
ncbi:hypothetical protein FISHEDRAFT_40150 [Fistulina hepatica ATCC 64428]|uniref:CID domain-containing protein n=1 Tax=Fistulina hepatica ATCC 64428 TaxID=1128425 RepID=A0A0D7AFY1_9AGAR|nr:hypothetical protein FISHEDRAFT_40150 [Fistulina hepatica ATCC 64428]